MTTINNDNRQYGQQNDDDNDEDRGREHAKQ